MMSFVRTVRGDLPAGQLGFTYMHEHLLGQPQQGQPEPDLRLDQPAAMLQELTWFRLAGGRALVEMSPRDYGRDPAGLRALSEAAQVHIVCVTGYIKAASADPFVDGRTVDDLAAEMIRDIEDGIGATGVRAGVIKAGSSLNRITANEEKIFRAAARAHRVTGAPISTHTEAGTMALEQVALLASEGVAPERILLGHLDRKLDLDYHLQVLETGAHIGIDQWSKEKYYPDAQRVAVVKKLVDAGYRDRLCLSGDLAKRANFPAYGGGPGYTFILWRIVPWLRQAGLTNDDIEALFVRTPARLLAFSAPTG